MKIDKQSERLFSQKHVCVKLVMMLRLYTFSGFKLYNQSVIHKDVNKKPS